MQKIWNIASTGHINLARIKDFNEAEVRRKIRSRIAELQKDYLVLAYCGCADGADMLFVREVLDCGAGLVAVLPCTAEEFALEHGDGGVEFMRVLAKAKKVLIVRDEKNRYVGVSRTMVQACDELFAIWDGVELPLKDEEGNDINLGGTYDTILRAREAKKVITLL